MASLNKRPFFAACLLLMTGSCHLLGDCFFEGSGNVTDCESHALLAGVSIAEHVDSGINEGKTFTEDHPSDTKRTLYDLGVRALRKLGDPDFERARVSIDDATIAGA